MTQHSVFVDQSSAVTATPDEVWACIADPSIRPGWMTELRRVEATPGPVSVGDRFTGQSSILLHDFIGSSEVTEAEPGRLLTEEVVIGARFVSRWEVVAEGRGTRVRHVIDVQFPAGPFSAIERWVLRRRLMQMQRTSLRNLADRFAAVRSE